MKQSFYSNHVTVHHKNKQLFLHRPKHFDGSLGKASTVTLMKLASESSFIHKSCNTQNPTREETTQGHNMEKETDISCILSDVEYLSAICMCVQYTYT